MKTREKITALVTHLYADLPEDAFIRTFLTRQFEKMTDTEFTATYVAFIDRDIAADRLHNDLVVAEIMTERARIAARLV